MFLVWKRAYNIPIEKNKPAEAKPWAIIKAILPEKEITLKENKPITHKFMWPIEAYAITLFISDCIAADIDVYTTETMHKLYTKELK